MTSIDRPTVVSGGGADSPTPAATDVSVAAADSMTVAAWTVVSRVTGLLRIAAIGAVLGPTMLGNTFQFTNALPNLLYYGLLAGSLFPSLLVPALVHHADIADRRACERLAGGFLGATAVALAVVVPLAVLTAPQLLGLTAPRGQGLAAEQVDTARLLFLMFAPQVFCYAVVGTATATMNSHQRFGLAAAAPALENVGIIAVLGVTALVHHGAVGGRVPVGELLLLGLGTTGAVAAHAAVQWWGACRVGVVLVPRAGWRDPEVRTIIRRALPSLGQAGVLAVQVVALLAAANAARGGVVGFQMALSFVYLVVAVAVTPLALGSLPWLARAFTRGEYDSFHDTFVRSLALALFVAVPAAVGCVLLSTPLARLVAVGRMAEGDGVRVIAASLAALATAVVGQAVFSMCSYAFYARRDTHTPLVAALVQVGVCLAGVGLSLHLLDGARLLLGLGASYSAGTLAGAACMAVMLRGRLHRGPVRLAPAVARTAVATAAMGASVWLLERTASTWQGRGGAAAAVALAVAAGTAVYAAVSRLLGAPELALLIGARRRSASTDRVAPQRVEP
ncbi:murein biosynthesis integral membrane protein MurJ [Pedococcus sp. 2YAF34]|uniref:murein biosynthesis integral membrane protein MurJ n=1 Tax=Pedococcus sp. 2YAF34 TaxID=3233032 RepID=UPI003F95C0D5